MPNPYYNTGYANFYNNPYTNATPGGYSYYMQPRPQTPQTPVYQQPMDYSQQPQQNGAFKWIYSEEQVQKEYVGPNCAITMWNANEPVLYLKQADATGKATIKTFDLVERVAEEKIEEPKVDYAKAEDLTNLVGVVNKMSENITSVVNAFGELKTDIDNIKGDMYGIAGKKKTVRKAEGEDDG